MRHKFNLSLDELKITSAKRNPVLSKTSPGGTGMKHEFIIMITLESGWISVVGVWMPCLARQAIACF